MPKKTLRELSARAIARGLDPATPAVAVANATRPDEAMVSGTISDIADQIDAAGLNGPTLVMIGTVFADAAVATDHASVGMSTQRRSRSL
jgi:uroporphyrin-III C-methyltransferase/precorrin-2 dehydrogenase/sirohydrochlorin ferrochelatase